MIRPVQRHSSSFTHPTLALQQRHLQHIQFKMKPPAISVAAQPQNAPATKPHLEGTRPTSNLKQLSAGALSFSMQNHLEPHPQHPVHRLNIKARSITRLPSIQITLRHPTNLRSPRNKLAPTAFSFGIRGDCVSFPHHQHL